MLPTGAISRFMREAQAAATLRSPHVGSTVAGPVCPPHSSCNRLPEASENWPSALIGVGRFQPHRGLDELPRTGVDGSAPQPGLHACELTLAGFWKLDVPTHVGVDRAGIQSRSSGACDTWRLVRGTDVRSVNVRGALRTNAPLVMRSLACQGAGLAFLPEWLVDKDLADKRLRRVLADWNSESITAWAIYRTELRGSPRVRAFIEALNA